MRMKLETYLPPDCVAQQPRGDPKHGIADSDFR